MKDLWAVIFIVFVAIVYVAGFFSGKSTGLKSCTFQDARLNAIEERFQESN